MKARTMHKKRAPGGNPAYANRAILLVPAAGLIATAAHADEIESQRRVLALISGMADSICSVVATHGETESSSLEGELHAQLKGLVSKLADAGISGSGNITSSQYQNILQKDLASTLKDNAACKLKVFETLQEKLLISAGGKGASWAPAPKDTGAEASFGFDTPCRSIDDKADAQAIILKYTDEALTAAPAARVLSRDRPVILRQSVGGSDMGAISANTRVRVICTEADGKFAIVKQEQGGRGGVVESNALEAP